MRALQMGQVERYGVFALCVVIFMILGIAIWGDGAEGSPVVPARHDMKTADLKGTDVKGGDAKAAARESTAKEPAAKETTARDTGAGDPLSATPTGYTSYAGLGQYFISGYIKSSTAPTPPTNLRFVSQ